jgi:MoxR-like ATPase
VAQTTAGRPAPIQALFTGEDVLKFHELVRKVPVAEEMVRYAVQLASSSRPHQAGTPDFVNEWVSWGAGTRAAQFLVLGAKARALLRGRAHVTIDDIQALAVPTLRHRILLNYRAEAEGVRVDDVVKRLVGAAKVPMKGAA